MRFSGPTDVVRFRYDKVWDRVQWQCPHMPEPEFLDNAQWRVLSVEPLTVHPSVHNISCGCHGFVKGGNWEPVVPTR